jgi:hypothetical protein
MNTDGSTQLTFVFGGLLGQNVTFEGLTALDGATWTNAETLFSASFGLHFGHVYAPFHCAREALRTYADLMAPSHLSRQTRKLAAWRDELNHHF